MSSHDSVAVGVNMRAFNEQVVVQGAHVDTNSNATMGRHCDHGEDDV